MLMSSATAECVSAPHDTWVTPVAATAPTVFRHVLPDAPLHRRELVAQRGLESAAAFGAERLAEDLPDSSERARRSGKADLGAHPLREEPDHRRARQPSERATDPRRGQQRVELAGRPHERAEGRGGSFSRICRRI